EKFYLFLGINFATQASHNERSGDYNPAQRNQIGIKSNEKYFGVVILDKTHLDITNIYHCNILINKYIRRLH
ncbi:hypothetical protein, partial [Porphyromonas levii]|uniref:hypothetical protein n=1 Tax=Porphyromonas levii TaxID=28114 RepID=UPI001B8B691E